MVLQPKLEEEVFAKGNAGDWEKTKKKKKDRKYAMWKHVVSSDESPFQIFYGNNEHCIPQAKEGEGHSDCYQLKV